MGLDVHRFGVLLCLLTLSPVAGARPVDQGHGRVSMQGSIIDTPCAIDVASRDQSIDMSVLPIGLLIRDGQGPMRPFVIRLVNCTLTPMAPGRADWSKFRVTFDGPVSDGRLFAVNGPARGVGLEISDADGNRALPGVALPAVALQTGNMNLDYTLRLVGNHQALRAGAYQAAIRFKLDYY